MIGAWVQAQAWKLGTVAASGAAVLLAGNLVLTKMELGRVDKERATLDDAIRNETTGYIVRLAQVRGNAAALDASLSAQSLSLYNLGAESATKLAAAEKSVAAAQTRMAKAEANVAILMKPLGGIDACARMVEMDRRLLETLK